MIRTALRSFIQTCRNHKALTLITFIGIACAFAALLMMQEGAVYREEGIQKNMTVRQFHFACDNQETLWETYEKISASDSLPEISVCKLANANCAGVYWNFAVNEEPQYTPYGRFFTEEEIEEGADVALLSMNAISRLSFSQIDSLWDRPIEIGNEKLTPVGSYYVLPLYSLGKKDDVKKLETSDFVSDVTLPLKTFRRLGLRATTFYCEFASPLTDEQISELLQMVADREGVQLSDFYNTVERFANFQNQSNTALFSDIPIYAFCILLAIQAAIHWMRGEFERLRIYRLCGAKRRTVAMQLLLEIFLLVTFSCLAGCGVNATVLSLMPQKVLSGLPLSALAGYWAVLLLAVLVAARIRADSVIGRDWILERQG